MKKFQLKINTQAPIKKVAKFSPSGKQLIPQNSWINGFVTPKKQNQTNLNQPLNYENQCSSPTQRHSLNSIHTQSQKNLSNKSENHSSSKISGLVFKKKKSILDAIQVKNQENSCKKIKKIMNNIKKVMYELENLILQVQQKFFSFTQEILKTIQEKFKQYNDFSNKNIVQIYAIKEMEKAKRENIKNKQDKVDINQIKLQQIPILDLSQIATRGNTPLQEQSKHTLRLVQTQRYTHKKSEFDCNSRIKRKFSIFNQTLNKIKRLSFGGSILKL